MLLLPPPVEVLSLLDEGEPLLPDTPLSSVPVKLEPVDEPLLPVEGLPVLDAYHALGIAPRRQLLLRASALDLLRQADAALPPRFRIVVLDAWRSREFQTYLVDYYGANAAAAGYVSDPGVTDRRPPHMTGGAIDLTLSLDEAPVTMGTDFDSFENFAHRRSFEHEDSPTRRLRRLLEYTLRNVGFAPYPLEWWHWSYGDDVWADTYKCSSRFDVVS